MCRHFYTLGNIQVYSQSNQTPLRHPPGTLKTTFRHFPSPKCSVILTPKLGDPITVFPFGTNRICSKIFTNVSYSCSQHSRLSRHSSDILQTSYRHQQDSSTRHIFGTGRKRGRIARTPPRNLKLQLYGHSIRIFTTQSSMFHK